MVFSTYIFVFYFLPLVLLVYYGLAFIPASRDLRSRVRNVFLLLASYVFYGWWNPWFVLLMLFVTAINYVCGKLVARAGATKRAQLCAVTLAVAASLGTLGFFKYFVFFQINLNRLIALLGGHGLGVWKILLPMGISFYTFQALSYTIDVYRGDAPPARSFPDFACYIALFPQLVAGPIVRYRSMAEQLVARSHSIEQFSSGVALFILGFCKKILLANPVGQIADATFGAESLTLGDAWFGALAYAFQIYFDFSGYSDMAIGLGRMLGFEFMKNFNAPYRADSITDFWRRWHISLSTFLRDYLYIPLGGNRRGPGRAYLNIAIVMLLGGLWHGANWTFVVWGAYHGTWLITERLLGKESCCQRFPRPLRIGVTFFLVLISWVIFRADHLTEAGRYLGAMFGGGTSDAAAALLGAELHTRGKCIVMVVCAALAFAPWQAHAWCERVTWPKVLALGPAFCLALFAMFAQAFNPFLYFQF